MIRLIDPILAYSSFKPICLTRLICQIIIELALCTFGINPEPIIKPITLVISIVVLCLRNLQISVEVIIWTTVYPFIV